MECKRKTNVRPTKETVLLDDGVTGMANAFNASESRDANGHKLEHLDKSTFTFPKDNRVGCRVSLCMMSGEIAESSERKSKTMVTLIMKYAETMQVTRNAGRRYRYLT